MSTKDLSILSYKELQALAVKHRVPGNIKKLLLVEILHAVKCGNNTEVKRLLTDLKKNRKKRTKRIKTMNTNEDGMLQVQRHDSGDPLQQDHYLFPIQQQQQQPQYPFEWVGAEEEVNTSKCEIKYAMNYEDIRHFMFYSSQNLSSSSLIDQIVDLRTEPTITSHYQTTLENGQLDNGQLDNGHLDNAKSLSVLLKKMLQAPVGANLSEIASPVSNRSTCNLQNYQSHDDIYTLLRPNRSPSPDTSETMSAKSDFDDEFDLSFGGVTPVTSNVPRILDSDRNFDNSYYRRTNDFRPTLECSVESTSLQNYNQQQMYNQYQFNLTPSIDVQDNCKSWFVSNSLDMSNSIDFGTSSTSRVAPIAIQYPNSESTDILNTSPGHSSNVIQYSVASESLYSNQSAALLEPSDLVPDMQFDSTRLYQSVGLDQNQEPQDFYHQIQVSADSYNVQQQQQQQQQQQPQQQQQSSEQTSCPDYAQQLAGVGAANTAPIYHVELDNVSYEPGYYQEQQPATTVSNQTTDPLQQVQDQPYGNYVSQSNNYFKNNPPPAYVPAPLDPYWPRWMSNYEREANVTKTNGRSLENTLNLCTPNYVDYTKLNETNCVYSNKTPVMTLRKGLNSISMELVRCGSTEPRQPNLNTNLLLYGEDSPSTQTGQLTEPVVTSDQQDTFAANWMLYEQEANNEVKRISTPRVSFEGYQADDLGIL